MGACAPHLKVGDTIKYFNKKIVKKSERVPQLYDLRTHFRSFLAFNVFVLNGFPMDFFCHQMQQMPRRVVGSYL